MGVIFKRRTGIHYDGTGYYFMANGVKQYIFGTRVGDIGVPGTAGFGVGVCPPASLPPGMTPLAGYTEPTHPNYGNYVYEDGSFVVFVPKFYYRFGTGANGVSLNAVDIKGVYDFTDTAAANAAGYALHRVYIDGGAEKVGFFKDKFPNSKNAKGTGFVCSSLPNGLPLSTNAAHNPMADLTASGGVNAYYKAIDCAHARDGVDGAINPASRWFVASRFMYGALALLALAQQSGSDGWCAWFDSKPYPKGCNNNALRDTDDTSVLYQSDGYSNCGKAGSGVPFAKTTHNGQVCGVADLNGLMYEIALGITCIAASQSVTGISEANPAVVTIVGHGYTTGDIIQITSVAAPMTVLNDKLYTITVIDPDNFSLDGVNTVGVGAWISGGTCTKGAFYAAKEATCMKDFTGGNALATDHWGATGVAAMMDALAVPLKAAAGGSAFARRFGSGANQVLSEAVSGGGWLLTGLGLPKDTNAFDATGTDPFGKDYYYQYLRNELCLLSCANWADASTAGVWCAHLGNLRPNSSNATGWRCACYPV